MKGGWVEGASLDQTPLNSYSITLIRRLASSLRGISSMDGMLTNCLPGKTKIILDNMFAAQISINSYIFHKSE